MSKYYTTKDQKIKKLEQDNLRLKDELVKNTKEKIQNELYEQNKLLSSRINDLEKELELKDSELLDNKKTIDELQDKLYLKSENGINQRILGLNRTIKSLKLENKKIDQEKLNLEKRI